MSCWWVKLKGFYAARWAGKGIAHKITAMRALNAEGKIMGERITINIDRGPETRMHWGYFFLVGWWLGLMLVCTILPLFFKGGRGLVKKAFGVW